MDFARNTLKPIVTIFFAPRHQAEKKHVHMPCIQAATAPRELPPGKRMETTMASKPITHQADLTTSAPYRFAASLARMLVAFARAPTSYGPADGAARPRSPSAWFRGVAVRAARGIAQEVRIRRDTRALLAMSDRMLKDIGLTRAEIGGAVRYGRG
jgi:uncharacterized protein YjiS (DUF1127 family)